MDVTGEVRPVFHFQRREATVNGDSKYCRGTLHAEFVCWDTRPLLGISC